MKIRSLAFVAALLLIGAAFPLASCGLLPNTTTPATTQVQTDSALLTAGVAAVAAAVETSPTISAADKLTIQNDVTAMQAANAAIQGATATAGGSAQQIAAALAGLAPIVLALVPVGSPEAIAIQAAQNLLPVFLAAATGSVPATAMARSVGIMPVAEARLVLAGYARGR